MCLADLLHKKWQVPALLIIFLGNSVETFRKTAMLTLHLRKRWCFMFVWTDLNYVKRTVYVEEEQIAHYTVIFTEVFPWEWVCTKEIEYGWWTTMAGNS